MKNHGLGTNNDKICAESLTENTPNTPQFIQITDYGRPEGKWSSLHSQIFNPNPKFLVPAEAYFVCHIGPIFQIA